MTSREDRLHHDDTSRVEAFSDGVFAIAITLLVLEIAVPEVQGSESLGRALLRLWPSYMAYAVSFITIGIMWANHHALFRDIERTDHTLLMLNLLLLLCIGFVPFPTALTAEYLKNGDHQVPAVLTLGATYTITAITFMALWLYASRDRRLIDAHVSDARLRQRTRRYLPGTPLYAITMPLAFVSVWLSLGLWALMAALYMLPIEPE